LHLLSRLFVSPLARFKGNRLPFHRFLERFRSPADDRAWSVVDDMGSDATENQPSQSTVPVRRDDYQVNGVLLCELGDACTGVMVSGNFGFNARHFRWLYSP
jgi:hypothetical protein